MPEVELACPEAEQARSTRRSRSVPGPSGSSLEEEPKALNWTICSIRLTPDDHRGPAAADRVEGAADHRQSSMHSSEVEALAGGDLALMPSTSRGLTACVAPNFFAISSLSRPDRRRRSRPRRRCAHPDAMPTPPAPKTMTEVPGGCCEAIAAHRRHAAADQRDYAERTSSAPAPGRWGSSLPRTCRNRSCRR